MVPPSTSVKSEPMESAYTNSSSVTERCTSSERWQYSGMVAVSMRMHVMALTDCITWCTADTPS